MKVKEKDLPVGFIPTATFPEPSEKIEKGIMEKVGPLVEAGVPVRLVGPPGTGKTSEVKAWCDRNGYNLTYLSLSLIVMTDLAVPVLVTDKGEIPLLEWLVDEQLRGENGKWVLFLDELSRTNPTVQNAVLEIVQSRRVVGHELENLVGVLAADNAGKREGIQSEPDMAMMDRFATVFVDSSSTAWQQALAVRFPETDLHGVFKVYRELTPELRWHLSPRKLEQVIYNLLRGNPFIWSISLLAGDRQWWVDEHGNDRTFEIGEKLAAALGVPLVQKVDDPVAKAVDCLIRDRVNVLVEGAPGIGKTAYIEHLLEKKGVDAILMSAPACLPSDFAITAPVNGKLQRIPQARFLREAGKPKAMLLDEVWRAKPATRNSLMEPLMERSVAGVQLPNFLGTIATNNPKEVSGRKLDVGRPDPAQAGRFAISISLADGDIPALEYILAKYEDLAEPVVAWYQEDLPEGDPSRVLITMRTLERLIKLIELELPLEYALITEGGERVCAAHLPALRERLEKRPLARLKSIAANVDEWEEWLSEGEGAAKQYTNPDKHHAVYAAFSKALLPQLEEARPTCIRLFRVLDNSYRIALIRSSKDKQAFWSSVLREAVEA